MKCRIPWILSVFLLLVVLFLSPIMSDHRQIFLGETMNLSLRSDVEEIGRAAPDAIHSVVFGIVQKNQDRLQQVLLEVSTPGNPNYGKHWTKDQVDELTRNQEGHDTLLAYLQQTPEIEVESESRNGAYVTAKAPVRVWERFFQNEFFQFHLDHTTEKDFIRCKMINIPSSLQGHVAVVMNTTQLPPPPHRGPIHVGPLHGGIQGGPVRGGFRGGPGRGRVLAEQNNGNPPTRNIDEADS